MRRAHREQAHRMSEIDVHIAATEAEREAVFRFRYEVYVEEMGRYQAVADHGRRRLADPEDDHSCIVYAQADGEVVASLRLTWGGDGFSPRQVDQYQLAPFLAELPADRMLVGERTMVAAHWRGSDLFDRLGEVSSAWTADRGVLVVFGACEPHLLSFYAHHQRPYGTRNVNSADAGFLLPLVSFPAGVEALVPFGTGGRLPRCIEQAETESGTVLSPMFVGEEVYEQRVLADLAALPESVFEGLDEDQVRRCLRRSNVVTCRQGDRLLKTGGAARNAFVVLAGGLAVSRDGEAVGRVGPGGIVGEMAYLLRRPRGSDVDAVEDGTRVLSLSERTLTLLPTEDPAAAAMLVANISRQICERLAGVPVPQR